MNTKTLDGKTYEFTGDEYTSCTGCVAWKDGEDDRDSGMCEALECGGKDYGPYKEVSARAVLGTLGSDMTYGDGINKAMGGGR